MIGRGGHATGPKCAMRFMLTRPRNLRGATLSLLRGVRKTVLHRTPLSPTCIVAASGHRLCRKRCSKTCPMGPHVTRRTACLNYWSAMLVATEEQGLTAQRDALAALGVDPDRVYVDHGFTGKKRIVPNFAKPSPPAGPEIPSSFPNSTAWPGPSMTQRPHGQTAVQRPSDERRVRSTPPRTARRQQTHHGRNGRTILHQPIHRLPGR